MSHIVIYKYTLACEKKAIKLTFFSKNLHPQPFLQVCQAQGYRQSFFFVFYVTIWMRYHQELFYGKYMGKAHDFKNHVTPAVFSFVVTSTYV